MSILLGQLVTDFTSKTTENNNITLSDLSGSQIVLFFYPKDNTPGCTSEALSFKHHYEDFKASNTLIFGVSKDNLQTHEKFKKKYSLPFDLIADTDEKLCTLFDVIKKKTLYGKEHMGIERSTFLIDRAGIMQHEWRKVLIKNHVEDVLQATQAFK
ncbi:MAG: peroxiredoxin [Candidatus Endonucleobacter bathymodioli]|uniref:thioredoxin-dependent peroxiredoxin n=1 Tax=Candidatus Endonucleibacter bathymodioli TaxID=539814 RepID=A0AA90NVX6_9GAMM|nr:peroxiredoxin [Candidatus Endonucleobacter bathymodioli]MDP0590300.1 peroxiredoxin [Candidatus Endonucleobacter bathymodioli]